jgi:hypothetical protein
MKRANGFTDNIPTPRLEEIDGKPALQLPGDGLLLGDFATALGQHLRDADVFARQGCAFTLDHEGQKLDAVTPGWLRTWIEGHVVPFRTGMQRDGTGNTITLKIKKSMTEDVARAVNVSTQFLDQLHKVERFHPCPMPVLRADGRIELLAPGMDAASMTFTADAGFVPELMPIAKAATSLRDLLSEFAWTDDGGRSLAVHLSAMLTVFAGSILPSGTVMPVFVYLGNAEGAGKTLLAQLAGIAYAKLPAAEAAPTKEEEWQKKLLALTISGRRVVLFDNLKCHLNSPSLEAYVTSPTFGGRILGVTKEFSGEAGATLLITGNGLTISPDMRRRSLLVELFMPELRSEDRKFKRILDAETIREVRPAVVSALWSIVRAWDEAGRPACSHGNASFPRWAKTIAGMVEFAGFGSPLAPAEIEGMGDTDTVDFAVLVGLMKHRDEYTFGDLTAMAEGAGLFERIFNDTDKDGNLSARGKQRLAKMLARYAGRQVAAGVRFMAIGKGHGRRYSLQGQQGQQGVSANGKNIQKPNRAKDHADLAHLAAPEGDYSDGDPFASESYRAPVEDPEDADTLF